MAERKVDGWDRWSTSASIDVNIKGVRYGIATALPYMREQKSGHIINLCSVAGHTVFPNSAVHCGTKFAVRALSKGLRMEVAPDIRGTIISPGAVATELTHTITHAGTAAATNELYRGAIGSDAVARAIAVAPPEDVAINEVLLRPTAQIR